MKRKTRYYAAVGRIPKNKNYIGFGRSADEAIADLRDDLYSGDEERMKEVAKSYGREIILEAVFSSKSTIKLESI